MPKKGCLGCSFPVLISIIVVFLVLIIIGLLSGALGQALVGETGLGDLFALEKPRFSLYWLVSEWLKLHQCLQASLK